MPLSPPVSRQLRHQRAIHAVAYERDDGLWDIEACLTDRKSRDVPLATGIVPSGMPIHELWLRITIDRKLNIVDAEAATEWAPYAHECRAANPAYRALIGLNLLRQFRREANRLLAGTTGCTHLTELCGVLPTAAIQAFAGDVWDTTSSSGPGEDASMAQQPQAESVAKSGPVPDAASKTGVPGATGPEPGNGASGNATSTKTTPSPFAPAPSENTLSPENAAPPFQLDRCHALRFDGEAVRQFYPRWYGRAPRSLAREGASGLKDKNGESDKSSHKGGDKNSDNSSKSDKSSSKPGGQTGQSNSKSGQTEIQSNSQD